MRCSTQVHHNVLAQKRFISDAAHQLRTPLAGLKSQTELALGETTDPAMQARLQRVHQSATRSAHLVSQLLTLARAEPESANRQHRGQVDLARLAREVTAEMVPRALASGVDLGFDEVPEGTAPTAMQVPGIGLLLREALVNLIDNAIRYAGRRASVTVRVRATPDQVLLEVEDDGPACRRTCATRCLSALCGARKRATAAAWAWPSCAKSPSATLPT